MYINSDIFSLMGIIGYLSSGFVYTKFGLRATFASMFLMSTIGGLLIVFVGYAATDNGNAWVFPFLVMFATFGTASCFNLVYITHANIFPTLFAATAMGIVNFCARIATIFAPEVAKAPGKTGMIIFSFLSALSFVLSLFLKKDKPNAK